MILINWSPVYLWLVGRVDIMLSWLPEPETSRSRNSGARGVETKRQPNSTWSATWLDGFAGRCTNRMLSLRLARSFSLSLSPSMRIPFGRVTRRAALFTSHHENSIVTQTHTLSHIATQTPVTQSTQQTLSHTQLTELRTKEVKSQKETGAHDCRFFFFFLRSDDPSNAP